MFTSMLTAVRSHAGRDDERSEDGFTLIELMIVVLIIGILLAIAIPTFLGARDRANNRSVQSNLRNALTAEKTLFTDNQTYTDTGSAGNIAVLKGIEPSLNWVAATTAASATGSVSAALPAAGQVVLGTKSATGECWFIGDVGVPASTGAPTGTYYASTKNCAAPAGLPVTTATLPAAGSQSDGAGAWALSFGV